MEVLILTIMIIKSFIGLAICISIGSKNLDSIISSTKDRKSFEFSSKEAMCIGLALISIKLLGVAVFTIEWTRFEKIRRINIHLFKSLLGMMLLLIPILLKWHALA